MIFPYVIGSLEDKTGMLIPHDYKALLGFQQLNQVQSFIQTSQPLSLDLMLFLGRFIDPIDVWNVFLLVNLGLNIFFGYKLSRLFLNKSISGILTLLLCIHPFVQFKMDNHLALFSLWNLTLGLYLILKLKNTIKDSIFLGLYFALVTIYSNYYGYFLFLAFGIYSLLAIKAGWKRLLFSILTAGTIVSIILFPYVAGNLLHKHQSSNQEKITYFIGNKENTFRDNSWQIDPLDTTAQSTSPYILNRPLEDFFYFSSRPWYLFLAPVNNPIYGDFSQNIITYLQDDWGNWLAQNYYMREHSAAFLGITNFILALIGGYFVFIKKTYRSKYPLKRLALTALIILLLTMPPFITISGFKIYLPSFILSQAFPMFRGLVRMSMIFYAVMLIFTGIGFSYIYKTVKNKVLGIIIIGLLIFLSVSELIVPFKVTDLSNPPEIYTYIKENTPKDSVIAVYPHEDKNQVMYWVREYQRPFINPGFNYPQISFNSKDFTDDLATCKGIQEAKRLGVDYVLFFSKKNKKLENEKKSILLCGTKEVYTFQSNEDEFVLIKLN